MSDKSWTKEFGESRQGTLKVRKKVAPPGKGQPAEGKPIIIVHIFEIE